MTTKSELVTLEASGLIQIATVQPELEYLFRHALVQDAAYSSLLKQDRGDRRLLADAYFWIAFMRRVAGESPESSPKLKRAVERAELIGESLGDPAAHAIPKAFMGVGVMFTGELRQGAQLLSEALEGLEGRADALSTAILSGFLAMTYARLGEFDDALRALARSERFAAQGDEIARLDNDIARTSIHLERGDIDDAQRLGSHCAETAETLGAVSCAVAANVLLGQTRLILEDALGA